jgi:hypothetical protein
MDRSIKFVKGPRALGNYAARVLDPAARARGFATTALLTDWRTIAGAELAAFTMPDRLVWPRRRDETEAAKPPKNRRGEGATLVLRVDGPRGIEVQHRAGQILERLNGYFGYRAITELRLRQAPITRAARARAAAFAAKAEPLPASSGIDDENLRLALGKLAAAVRARVTRA